MTARFETLEGERDIHREGEQKLEFRRLVLLRRFAFQNGLEDIGEGCLATDAVIVDDVLPVETNVKRKGEEGGVESASKSAREEGEG